MQHPGIADDFQRQVRRTHSARRGARAKVAEFVAAAPVGHEVDAGRRLGIDSHAARVDALALPETEKFSTEGIVAQAREIRRGGAEARGGDDAVRGVAAEALQVLLAARASLVEFQHRLAERNDIEACVALERAHQRGFKRSEPRGVARRRVTHRAGRGARRVQVRACAEAVGAGFPIRRHIVGTDAADREDQRILRQHRAPRFERGRRQLLRGKHFQTVRPRVQRREGLGRRRDAGDAQHPETLRLAHDLDVAMRHDDQLAAGSGNARNVADSWSPFRRRSGNARRSASRGERCCRTDRAN